MNKVLLIFNNKLHESVIFLMQGHHNFSPESVIKNQTKLLHQSITIMWYARLPVRHGLSNCGLLKLKVLPLVQTTRGFGNPCYSERVVVHLSESIWFGFLITYYQDHSERSWGVLNRVLAWLYPFAYFEHIYKPVVAKYLNRILYSSCKNNNQIACKHKCYCNNITIVKLVWTVLLCGAQLI